MCQRIDAGWSLAAAAEAAGVSERRAREWRRRWEAGDRDLEDRPSVAHTIPAKTPAEVEEAVCALRELRFSGTRIAHALGMPERTVRAILARNGLSRLPRPDAHEPANRYERPAPGELIHIDVKKLGRIQGGAGKRAGDGIRRSYRNPAKTDAAGVRRQTTGWEYVHVAIDDATRLAYVEVLPDEKAITAIGFLGRAVKHYATYGIAVERLITDNGSAYRSAIHALACRALGIRHLRTRPYRPQTNGKACVLVWLGRPVGRRGSSLLLV
jgi:transposase InsO family protein